MIELKNCINCNIELYFKTTYNDSIPRAECNECDIYYVIFTFSEELAVYFDYNNQKYVFCYLPDMIKILANYDSNNDYYKSFTGYYKNLDNKIYSYNQTIAMIENQIFK